MKDERPQSATSLEETSLLAAPEAFVSPSHAPEAVTGTLDEGELRDTVDFVVKDLTTGSSLWGRWRLWELPTFYHWSILGICLSPAELAVLVEKMNLVVPPKLSDYELYGLFVELARERGTRGRLLEATLDAKYEAVVEDFHMRASTEEHVLELWSASLSNGDIAGAYWALLTHPATGPRAYQQAFKDLQLTSLRLVAAGGDHMGWLQQLEAELREARGERARIEDRLRQRLRERETRIEQLEEQLAQLQGEGPGVDVGAAASLSTPDEVDRLRAQVAALEWRVVLEAEWAKGAQGRTTSLVKELQVLKEKLTATEQENTMLRWAYEEAMAERAKTSRARKDSSDKS